MIRQAKHAVSAALFLACILSASNSGISSALAGETVNSVAAFLQNAETQYETDAQRKEIERALRDMLKKSPTELRKMRYADYGARRKVWSITEVLHHYFVPNSPAALDEEGLLRDYQAPEARAAIRRQLAEVNGSE